MLLASRRVPCNHVPLLFPLVLTFCCLSSPLLSVANLEAPSSTLLGAPQRRQPGSSIVNASWRHDGTSEFSSASTAVQSSFRSLFQTFAFRWPSAVWDPRTTSFFATLQNPSSQPPSFPSRCVQLLQIFECLGGNFHLSCHVPRYASFPVIFFTLLTGGTVRTTTFCH